MNDLITTLAAEDPARDATPTAAEATRMDDTLRALLAAEAHVGAAGAARVGPAGAAPMGAQRNAREGAAGAAPVGAHNDARVAAAGAAPAGHAGAFAAGAARRAREVGGQ
ncbi:hypothetical protein OJ997_36315, partial [Solirubrobacter phytolaccae]